MCKSRIYLEGVHPYCEQWTSSCCLRNSFFFSLLHMCVCKAFHSMHIFPLHFFPLIPLTMCRCYQRNTFKPQSHKRHTSPLRRKLFVFIVFTCDKWTIRFINNKFKQSTKYQLLHTKKLEISEKTIKMKVEKYVWRLRN